MHAPTLAAILVCAGFAAADDAPDPRRLKPDHAPTPYTAAQIRAGCPAGRASTYLVEAPDRADFKQIFRFVRCDEKGADLEVTRATTDGKAIGEPSVSYGTWKQYQSHGSYPEKATKISEAKVKLPAGEFDCWLYTVTKTTGEKTTVTRVWFAKKLAGPPVKMTVSVAKKPVYTMSLVAHRIEKAEE